MRGLMTPFERSVDRLYRMVFPAGCFDCRKMPDVLIAAELSLAIRRFGLWKVLWRVIVDEWFTLRFIR